MAIIELPRSLIRNNPKEHYELLAEISKRNSYLKIIDAGTFMGLSAIHLATNGTNNVTTYDISDKHVFKEVKLGLLSNLKFILGSINDEPDRTILDTDLIFLDIDPHDGIQEKIFSDRIVKIKYRGVVICDDIYLNEGMKKWWENLRGIKIDLTHLGHFSGTGLWIPETSDVDIEIK